MNLSSLRISPAQLKISCIIYVHCIWIPANLKIWLLLIDLSYSWSLRRKHNKGAKHKHSGICHILNYMQIFNLSISHIHLSEHNFKVRALWKAKFKWLILASPIASAYCHTLAISLFPTCSINGNNEKLPELILQDAELEGAEGNQEQHQALRFHVTWSETADYV